jgi:uncharacterized protein (DUF1810 family)
MQTNQNVKSDETRTVTAGMNNRDTGLDRFVRAQERDFDQALRELEAGHKRSHWIWYVLPQLRGLGHSSLAREFGIEGRREAVEYLAHPVLGPRLIECVNAMLRHSDRSAVRILGEVDAMKFRSCLTLFAAVTTSEPCFTRALQQFYPQGPDLETLRLLDDRDET